MFVNETLMLCLSSDGGLNKIEKRWNKWTKQSHGDTVLASQKHLKKISPECLLFSQEFFKNVNLMQSGFQLKIIFLLFNATPIII